MIGRAVLTLAVVTHFTKICVIAEKIDASSDQDKKDYQYQNNFLSMIGNAHLQYHPTFYETFQEYIMHINHDQALNWDTEEKEKGNSKYIKRRLGKKGMYTKKGKKASKSSYNDADLNCDPADVDLLQYPQWQEEKGYWIGEYTFLQSDGNPFVSSTWNYPYDHYKGFITGNVVGNSYSQRNVFFYPPQVMSMCNISNEADVVGDGNCGVNGNTKVFEADQSATTCSLNEELGGDIEGPYVQGPFVLPTKTELIGQDNALLYQVFVPGAMLGQVEDILFQSQLTTITKNPISGQVYRTRTNQSFDAFSDVGATTSASYYRERKVDKHEFYEALNNTIVQYNIRNEDLCVWDSNNNKIENVTGAFVTCENHLEQSFSLGSDM